MENRIAARSLSDEQLNEIGVRLRSFAPQTFQIIPYWDDAESKNIADQIALALNRVGWTLENPERYTALMGVMTGIVIRVDQGAPQKVGDAAKILADALNEDGIAASEVENDIETNQPSDRVNMQVGIKP